MYTVSQESKYLLIQGVPAVGATDELVKLCASYGPVEEYKALDDYPAEQFSEVYLIKYQRIQSARFLTFTQLTVGIIINFKLFGNICLK